MKYWWRFQDNLSWRLWKRRVRFWWQRRTRGWDDSELWGLDYTLAQWLAPRLRRFIEIHHTYPGQMTPLEWDILLTEMAEGFEILIAEGGSWPWDESEYQRVEHSLDLLRVYFKDLWD